MRTIINRYRNLLQRLVQRILLYLSVPNQSQPTVNEIGALPVPPPHLRKWVAGTEDIDWFLKSGKAGEQTILSILAKHQIQFDKIDAILDFGCGCGRVIRHLHRLDAPIQIHGTDINSMAIAWCDENLNFAEFGTNRLEPPTRYRQNSFDLIYAFSVFTHLTQPLQAVWMREMQRIVKPGGYLIITVHGDYYLQQIPETQKTEYQKGNLVVIGAEKAGLNYCAAFHPESYVRNVLAKEAGFTVVDFLPQGALGNPYQDAYLLQALAQNSFPSQAR